MTFAGPPVTIGCDCYTLDTKPRPSPCAEYDEDVPNRPRGDCSTQRKLWLHRFWSHHFAYQELGYKGSLCIEAVLDWYACNGIVNQLAIVISFIFIWSLYLICVLNFYLWPEWNKVIEWLYVSKFTNWTAQLFPLVWGRAFRKKSLVRPKTARNRIRGITLRLGGGTLVTRYCDPPAPRFLRK